MKQTVPSEAAHTRKPAAAPARPLRTQQTVAPDGSLAQLAAMVNGSPRVQALAQLKDAMRAGPRQVTTDQPEESSSHLLTSQAPVHASPIAQRAPVAVAQRELVIQRAIIPVVAYANPVDASHQAKMTAVVQYFTTSLAGINNGIANLNINVKTMALTDPARTNRAGADINVDLADWFVISASVGDITGMLAHEIGVHTLADAQQNWAEKNEEEQYQKNPFSVRVGLHKHTVSPWDDKHKKGGRQKDHVNVARDKGNAGQPLRSIKGQPQVDAKGKSLRGTGYDENSVNRRAEEYADTMLRLGDAIEADGTIGPAERDQRLHDLLNSFLFDYGRILATDDVAWHVADKTPLVAQVFNWYKNVIIGRHGIAHAWLQRDTMLPTASTWGLRAYLLGRITQSLSAKVLPEAVHNFAGAALNAGGQLLSGIGSTISSYTPDIVKQGGGLVASGAGKVLRAADYVYGEVENLVLPNVVAPLAWAGGKLAGGASWLGGALGWGKAKKP